MAASVEHIEGFLSSAAWILNAVAFNAAVGKVDTEHGFVPVHGRADIFGAGCKLRVDDAVAVFLFSVGELEDRIVDEGFEVGGIGAPWIRVGSVELDQRIELFDRRQAPIGVAARFAFRGVFESLGERHFFAGILRPHQAGHQIGDRAVAVVLVGGRVGGVLRVLSGIRVVGRGLPGIDDGVGCGCGEPREQGGCDGQLHLHG